ncbi:MAG: hypothetical protein ACQERD_03040 [Campylobacterota bacterium]
MFSKEFLYINAIKYDTQLKLDYKKIKNGELEQTNSSVFLVKDELLAHDIAQKINISQKEANATYISTLLISDTTTLVPKSKSRTLDDCEIAHFNSDYDIAVLKTTLFETQHYFEKTGIDYIYSAFHILNLHIEKNICKNQLLIFLFNNKAFIVILDDNSKIVFSKTIELPTFESVKKTHFYDDDVVGQKLYDEIYYLELSEIIHENLNSFYESNSKTFIEKITILYNLKQLSQEQINQLSSELLLKIDYLPINIDEEIFELSKDIHQKQSFIHPRKKEKKRYILKSFIALLILSTLGFVGYKLYDEYFAIKKQDTQPVVKQNTVSQELPDHVNRNDKKIKRIKAVFSSIPYDVVLSEFVIDEDALLLRGNFLKDDTYIKSLQPELSSIYKSIDVKFESENKNFVNAVVLAKEFISLDDVTYRTRNNQYIQDEFLSKNRVSEQLNILLPQKASIKHQSSSNDKYLEYNYTVNIEVNSPKEFFNIVEMINNELYSINLSYPISMKKLENGSLEVEFGLVFIQPN